MLESTLKSIKNRTTRQCSVLFNIYPEGTDRACPTKLVAKIRVGNVDGQIMNNRFACSIFFASALIFLSYASAAENDNANPSEVPLLIYYFAGNPQVKTEGLPWGTALIADALVSFGEHSNRALLDKLRNEVNQRDKKERFQDSLGCMFSPGGGEPCRQIHFLTNAPFEDAGIRVGKPSDELKSLLDAYGSKNVWILNVTEQFHAGGYYFSVRGIEAYVDPAGVRRYHAVQAMYADPYSARTDAISRGLSVDDSKVNPRYGSKEAKAAYWLGTAPTRLENAIAAAPQAVTALLRLMINLPPEKVLVSDPEVFSKLRKLGELRSKNKASCAAAYCSTRVLQDLGDRLYLEADFGIPWLISAPRWGL